MGSIQRFEDIEAWQQAQGLVYKIYAICNAGPLAKDYGLKDQLRRAAVSIMANIAEGYGRRSPKEFAYFLDIARSSAFEVQSLLYVVRDVHGLPEQTFVALYQSTDKIQALIAGLTAYLRSTF